MVTMVDYRTKPLHFDDYGGAVGRGLCSSSTGILQGSAEGSIRFSETGLGEWRHADEESDPGSWNYDR